MDSKQNLASNPSFSAAVVASAGTGKTWTLVSRLLRLLLQGAESGNILAITFTVRAAAEMRQRLLERLEKWSVCDESELIASLKEIGHPTDRQSLTTARKLFSEQLNAKTPVRALTFHAFFQEILSQLAVEAGVPSGFELTENTFDHEQIALELLLKQAHEEQDSPLAKELMVLLEKLGYSKTRDALKAFLKQRSDWWAWTEGIENAEERISFAQKKLAHRQGVDFETDHANELLNELFLKKLQNFIDFYTTDEFAKGINDRARKASLVIGNLTGMPAVKIHEALSEVLLKKEDGTPYVMKDNAKVRKLFNEERLNAELKNYHDLCDQLNRVAEQLKRQENYQINSAWYHVGEHYLEFFQKQKRQQRQLDFSDLEWKAYQLLNNTDDFSLVRSKLDDAVEHLLIDEFQDTNPTQWQFVMPLLQDFADTLERKNNLFIVGDSKQSIYGFRRANPALLNTAANWIEENVTGKKFEENNSYRSAAAIMDAVNKIFSPQGYLEAIQDFEEHGTHKDKLWGRVEIWPEFRLPVKEKNKDQSNEAIEFRNPLLNPLEDKTSAYHLEAAAIAEKIEDLIASKIAINDEDPLPGLRPATYGDIQILVRKRTHVGKIEKELQARKIPFKASTRGSYMARIEIKDLCALLRTVVTPTDDLSLAHVLRSPIFSLSNSELMLIANSPGDSWYERIQTIAATTTQAEEQSTTKIIRATTLLQQWRKLAQKLPLHDLVTTIFYQGNIINRYLGAFPSWQSAQLTANLQRFIELALEVNSGRYPGVHHFLQHLQLQASANDSESISEPIPTAENSAINILTIHEAKGLEAPIVFVANCNQEQKANTSGSAVVDWPPENAKPRLIALQTAAEKRDELFQSLQTLHLDKEKREAANLLYVALTRAKQFLIVSASRLRARTKNNTKNIIDINIIRDTLNTDEKFNHDEIIYIETAETKRAKVVTATKKLNEDISLSPKLKGKLTLAAYDIEIAPSHADDKKDSMHGTADGRLRGKIIHEFLHQLIAKADKSNEAILSEVSAANSLEATDPRLIEWFAEAQQSVASFPELLINQENVESYTELPVIYNHENNRVHGIIDRILIEQDLLTILDFKTHRYAPEDQATLAQSFSKQMDYYAQAATLLWPERKVKTGILFTTNNELIWL